MAEQKHYDWAEVCAEFDKVIEQSREIQRRYAEIRSQVQRQAEEAGSAHDECRTLLAEAENLIGKKRHN